jgi:hypothetical protein
MKWPVRIVEGLGREPRVGDWYAECCALDLVQIDSDEMLHDILENYDDMDSGGGFWATREMALQHLDAAHEEEKGRVQ